MPVRIRSGILAKNKTALGVAQLAAGAVMISFSAVFVKLAHVGPTTAGFYRMLFGGIVLSIVLWIKKKSLFHGFSHFALAFLCGVFFTLDLTFWHRSILSVGPGLSTLLANFQVFFLAGFGVLMLRERVSWQLGVSIPVAMIGLWLIVGLNWGRLPSEYKGGVGLGLAAALSYAAYVLILRKLQTLSKGSDALVDIALISVLSCLMMGCVSWAQHEQFRIPDLQSWFALLGYGVAGQVLGWVLISMGLPKTGTSVVGLVLLLQPILAFVWDILFFHRPVSVMEIMGAFLALSAIYLGICSQKRS